MQQQFGLGSISNEVYRDGLHVVVNLSSRTLTEAENALLSKGLSFCPTPAEIDVYALKKDVSEYMRRLRLTFITLMTRSMGISQIFLLSEKSLTGVRKRTGMYFSKRMQVLSKIRSFGNPT